MSVTHGSIAEQLSGLKERGPQHGGVSDVTNTVEEVIPSTQEKKLWWNDDAVFRVRVPRTSDRLKAFLSAMSPHEAHCVQSTRQVSGGIVPVYVYFPDFIDGKRFDMKNFAGRNVFARLSVWRTNRVLSNYVLLFDVLDSQKFPGRGTHEWRVYRRAIERPEVERRFPKGKFRSWLFNRMPKEIQGGVVIVEGTLKGNNRFRGKRRRSLAQQ